MADFGALRDQVLTLNLWAHGMDMIVERPAPDDTPITEDVSGGHLRGAWVPSNTTEDRPFGSSFTQRDMRKVVAFSRRDVPTLPIGTRIYAPEKMGGTPVWWIVDSHEQTLGDHWKALVVPVMEIIE